MEVTDDEVSPLMHVDRAALRYVQQRRSQQEICADTAANVRSTLLRFSEEVGDIPIGRLKPRHIERWLANTHVGKATLRRNFSRVRTFTKWCVLHGLLKVDPCSGIRGPRQPRSVPRGLSIVDITAVLLACPDSRTKAIVLLMCQEGLRCIEVARLELGDIDRLDWIMRVTGKGGHERYLPVSIQSQKAISDYLGQYPATAGPLFRSYRSDEPLKAQTISGQVSYVMKRAGVQATAHALRHSALQHMIGHGASVEQVRQIAGHTSLSATSVYLKREIAVIELRAAMAGREY